MEIGLFVFTRPQLAGKLYVEAKVIVFKRGCYADRCIDNLDFSIEANPARNLLINFLNRDV